MGIKHSDPSPSIERPSAAGILVLDLGCCILQACKELHSSESAQLLKPGGKPSKHAHDLANPCIPAPT